MTVTVWQNGPDIRLHQLSGEPADGTAQEQIFHLGRLEAFTGYTCVCDDFTGSVPNNDEKSWRWDGTNIIAAQEVPSVISPRQMYLILNANGLLDQVQAFVAQQERPIQIAWEKTTEFQRDDQLLNTMAEHMGITQDQIDQMFIEAATL